MATIQDLPNELIFAILRSQHPPDLSNLSLTCHRFHDLASPLIQEVREIRAYLSSSSSGLYIDLLRHVLKNPRFGLHVTYLRIVDRYKNWETFFSAGTPFMPSFAPLSDSESSLFQAAFAEFEGVFRELGWGAEKWMRQVESGDQGPALILLLCLLPELRKVTIGDLQLLHEAQSILGNQAADAAPASWTDTPPFVAAAKLESACFFVRWGEHGVRLVYVMPVAALLAVPMIGCHDFRQGTGLDGDLERLACLSRTDLRLEYSCSGFSASGYILNTSGRLRRFYYEYGGATTPMSAEFLPWEYRDIFLWHGRSTLEHLTLATPCDDSYDFGNYNPFAGSLREFEVLKTVDMHFEMLVDTDENNLVWDPTPIGGDTPKLGKLKKLANTLPASLEMLRIPGRFRDVEQIVDQLMDLLKRKEESQPKLTKIAIGSVDGLEASQRGLLEGACKAAGVSLEEWKPEDRHRWPDNPAW